MKKVLIFLAIIVVIFASIIFLNQYQNNQKLANNPYDTDNLDQSTIDQLDDPNYQNVIMPDDLKEKLANGESVTVYFFSPECSYCKEATPTVVPMASNLGIDLKLYNVLEFEEGWTDYAIEGTPTLIHFENGKEAGRLHGLQSEDAYLQWFQQYAVNE